MRLQRSEARRSSIRFMKRLPDKITGAKRGVHVRWQTGRAGQLGSPSSVVGPNHIHPSPPKSRSDRFLARGLQRQLEYVVRCALGAGRLRLFGQALTESLLVGLLGGASGMGLMPGTIRLFKAIGGFAIPRLDAVTMCWQWWHRVINDFNFAFRQLLKNPGFTTGSCKSESCWSRN